MDGSAGAYDLNDGSAWIVAPSDETQLISQQPHDAVPGGAWEEFMAWNPAQAQPSPKARNPQSPLSFVKPEQKPPAYTPRQPSVEETLSIQTVPAYVPHRLDGIPYSFGQPLSMAPAFDFGVPAFDPSTIPSSASTSFPIGSTWSPTSSLDAVNQTLVSPLSPDDQQLQTGSVPAPPISTPGLEHSPGSAHASHSQESSPEPVQSRNKKRKSSGGESGSEKTGKQGPVKKTSHNMIEKRYRTNLNDKIAALRDSVPSLRVTSRANGQCDEDDDQEDLDGLTPAHKLNKATVLSKATEYIRHLERRNKVLQDEVASYKARLQQYEKLANAGALVMPDGLPRYAEQTFPRPSAPQMPDPNPPQGLIPVPENIMNLHRAQAAQAPYPTPANGYPMYAGSPARGHMPGENGFQGRGRGSNFAAKLMVGSLAGLMFMEGFVAREAEKSGDAPEDRGLFALPFPLLRLIADSLVPKSVFGLSSHAAFSSLKLLVLLSAVIYVIAPLFDFKPRPKRKGTSAVRLAPVPSLASPVEVRRKAWLTAIQTVWVPRHSFLLELAALVLKTLKLSTRKLVGWHGYALLTGITKEQEAARVKAWDIALDAQLTGGDAEISMSRLILTLMASGTLPDTPVRLMLKALHIRVLLWEVAKAVKWFKFDFVGAKLSRRYWNASREEHHLYMNTPHDQREGIEALPEHLAALLELDSDDVLVAPIIQRAYNLAWNKPVAEDVRADESMDTVVEDFAISSPLDALAAWWSTLMVSHVLVQSLTTDPGADAESDLHADLELAIKTAPPTSTAHVRALVSRAVLVPHNRDAHIRTALATLPSRKRALPVPASPSSLLNDVSERPVGVDVKTALALAKCLCVAETSARRASRC
ncbi:hypothetical protein EJ06DRAFT_550814 [Trichodelitschia bisporula]|uniref:BHLH domain-containing protein n=1 Tax=Trichodelitschia bisporula TaxID=703511 RepID=A0A6G1HP88_9PEZI|nr:hypothetical protein EJ06DRAFT_550814 [Trichodelitschia bisporula]